MKRITVLCDTAATAILDSLIEAGAGDGYSGVIRNALKYYEFFRRVALEDAQVIVKHSDGSMERVVFPFQLPGRGTDRPTAKVGSWRRRPDESGDQPPKPDDDDSAHDAPASHGAGEIRVHRRTEDDGEWTVVIPQGTDERVEPSKFLDDCVRDELVARAVAGESMRALAEEYSVSYSYVKKHKYASPHYKKTMST